MAERSDPPDDERPVPEAPLPFAKLPWRWLRRDNGHPVPDSRCCMSGTPIDLDALTDEDLPLHLRRLIDRDIAIVIGAASLIASPGRRRQTPRRANNRVAQPFVPRPVAGCRHRRA
ncbi:MAG: hypothetical protein GDA49_09810 [Rhodospirillales bacterium]|nr:hypothetical protein [Rhodospirillales bacterium]